MSIKKISKNQPDTFEFNENNLKMSKEIICSDIFKLLSLNSNLSGCCFDIFLILIYLSLQKLYLKIPILQEHQLTYDLLSNNPLLEGEKNPVL